MKQSLQFTHLTELAKKKLMGAANVESVAPELIEFLANWFHCQWGTYWQVTPEVRALHAITTWSEPSVPLQKLRADTKSKSLSTGEGTAGQVWRTGISVCTDNLVTDMFLPRSLDAGAAGLVSGIWFPLVARATTRGVIELLGRHYWINDQRLIEQLRLLGQELGEVLKSLPDAHSTTIGNGDGKTNDRQMSFTQPAERRLAGY